MVILKTCDIVTSRYSEETVREVWSHGQEMFKPEKARDHVDRPT